MNAEEQRALEALVEHALAEDVGPGDLTAALVDAGHRARASVVCREEAVLCGRAWFETVFHRLAGDIRIDWRYADGDAVEAGRTVCTLEGPTRALLTGERTALNLLQTLSGTATLTARYRRAIGDLPVTLLDTRKTLPGMRLAQKYAVRCGGGRNHRIGLFDAILIKENHIAACGSITAAVERARALTAGDKVLVEVEVEDLDELAEALETDADKVLLDNFSESGLREAVRLRDRSGRPLRLEVSGGITLESIARIAATGIDEISVGALTKDVQAIDLSMRIGEGTSQNDP